MTKYSEKVFLFCLVVILGILLFTRYNYRHVPFERDEGEYAYAGSLLLHGKLPYQDAYNMKFPGTYFMYALIMKAGGETVEAIRIGVLLAVLLTAIALAGITWLLCGSIAAGALAAVTFCALTNTMAGEGLMANAEHFVNLFMAGGIFFLFLFMEGKGGRVVVFVSAVLLSTAVIMKQYGYAFCLFGLVALAAHLYGKPWRYAIKVAGLFAAGMALPALLLLIWVVNNGLWQKFYFLTIQYASAYISLATYTPFNSITIIYKSAVPVCILVAAAFVALLPMQGQRKARYLLAWAAFSALACATGLLFRLHYFILVYPALAVITGYVYHYLATRYNSIVLSTVVALPFILFFVLHKQEQFPADPMAVYNKHYEYQFFAEMPAIAKHINTLIPPTDKLSMYSNEPELYFYSGHIAASGYLYTYPLLEQHRYAGQMMDEYIRRFEANASDLFIYQGGYMQYGNEETHNRFENWWQQYSQGYYLSGIFCATGAAGGVFMQPEELTRDDKWKSATRFEFWMRKK